MLALAQPLVLASALIQAPAPAPRVLVLIGGELHAFEKNVGLLLDAWKAEGAGVQATVVRVDAPPAGKPAAEKATLKSEPALLADPKLRDRFDAILQYTQNDYLALDDAQKDGLLHFVRSGGGWVGVHSAADTMTDRPEYVRMLGARFESHPDPGPLSVQRIAVDAPIAGVGDFTAVDELYHLADCPGDGKCLLYATKSPGDGKLRPVAWTKRYGAGRVFYTALGHGPETWSNPSFQKLLLQGVRWAAAGEPPRVDDDGAIRLFNGVDLDGWAQVGPGRFDVEGGAIVTSGGMGMLWYERRAFRDFALELEWSVARKEDNSGVFVRFPPPVTPWTAVEKGYEVQICDVAAPKNATGAIYDFQAARGVVTKKPGDWNALRVEAKGQRYRVWVNGVEVNDFTGDRSMEGHVGIQNHDSDSRVRYRKLRVSELR